MSNAGFLPTPARASASRAVTAGSQANATPLQQAARRDVTSIEFDAEELNHNERRKITQTQAKQQQRMYSEAQRLLGTQRDQIASLRKENERMRLKLQAEQDSQQQSDSQKAKYNARVNHLMSLKFELEEQVEKWLEKLEVLRKEKKSRQKDIHDSMRRDKTPGKLRIGAEIESSKVEERDEKKIEYYQKKYSESLHKNFALRAEIDELRQDKMGMIRRIGAIQDKIDSSSEAIVQLINIANVYYTKRSHTRLVYSELVTQAGKESEQHRQEVAELSNRVEFFDQLMVDREEDFKQALVDAEHKASKGKDTGEEHREMEKKRQQNLIDAFNKLMHSMGVWNVGSLVDKFLQKEEKFDVQYRYLDALNADVAKLKSRIKEINAQAAEMTQENPVDDVASVTIKQQIKVAEDKAEVYRKRYEQVVDELERLNRIFGVIRKRMKACALLSDFKPAKQRWALVRANIRVIANMDSSKKKLLRSNIKAKQGLSLGDGRARNAYDPRRKLLREEVVDLDVAPAALACIDHLSVLEQATLRLLSYKKLKLEPKMRKRQALRLSLAMRALNQAKGVAEVQTTIKTGEVLGGPRHSVQPSKGRAEMLVLPNLKDIDSPRSVDGAMSPRDIVEAVHNTGLSYKVAENLKKEMTKKYGSQHSAAGQRRETKHGDSIAEAVLKALQKKKAAAEQGRVYDPYSEEEQANAPPRPSPMKVAASMQRRVSTVNPGGSGGPASSTMSMRRGSVAVAGNTGEYKSTRAKNAAEGAKRSAAAAADGSSGRRMLNDRDASSGGSSTPLAVIVDEI